MPPTLKIGIIGAGEVAQVIHLPTLAFLSHLYTITAICDVSEKTTTHCAQKWHIPLATTNPDKVINSDADIIFVLTSDESHETLTIAALKAGKHVMVEKPLTLSIPSVKRIMEAEKASGKLVFVGYMRRYAPSLAAFKAELPTKITYARSRDFPGPNPIFVAQSGAFPVRNNDISAERSKEAAERLDTLLKEVFPSPTQEAITYCRFMNTLGSHDISLLRDVLGMPKSVDGVSVNDPVYTALFNYGDFAVNYESGWDDVPDFDAHLAVYGQNKRVMIKYDTPFVKGLAIKVTIHEKTEQGIQMREIISSYEDAYTAELQELYECVVNGKPCRTTAADALKDQEIYDMMYRKWEAQEGGV